ncbi:MAG: class I SAM-dependent methyltransferase [Actinomycetota bacterium]|nr:class I SAM-dependent methyltransferase [Actinomycetota bacterium]
MRPGREQGEELAALRAEVEALRGRLDTLTPGAPPAARSRFDSVYPAFQDRFRGSEADVRERLQVYLPDVERARTGGDVLDVGPGRGEWLSMLAERGVPAYGVEASAQMTRVLRARGVPVVHADAVAHLQELEPGSLDVVTGFHVVEHLELEPLLELLTAARTALRPGGLLILETPNPMNLVMAACNFRLDPTHLQPLPPALTEFLVTAAGFRDVQVRMLHPKEPADLTRLRLPGVDDSTAALVAQALTKAFFGPQDYAVLARTPAHPAPQNQPG